MGKAVSEQVIVIMGASSGIGRATAEEAARRGAKVVLAARNLTALEDVAQQIERAGGTALPVRADVRDYAQVENVAATAMSRFGRIDTWINNAAVSLYGEFTQVSLEDFRTVLETNFMGQVHGAKAALPHLEKTGGALICVGSALSDRGVPLQGAYCASKHALKGWLDSLRVELRKNKSRVRVTLVKPSSINTPLFRKAKTHLGVEPMPIPPVYGPELAARVILTAAEKNVRDAFVGGAGKLLSVAERLSPALLDVYERKRGFDAQKTNWPRAAEAANNLGTPVERDGGTRGDFTHMETRRSPYQSLARLSWPAKVAAAVALVAAASRLRPLRQRAAT